MMWAFCSHGLARHSHSRLVWSCFLFIFTNPLRVPGLGIPWRLRGEVASRNAVRLPVLDTPAEGLDSAPVLGLGSRIELPWTSALWFHFTSRTQSSWPCSGKLRCKLPSLLISVALGLQLTPSGFAAGAVPERCSQCQLWSDDAEWGSGDLQPGLLAIMWT